jgi:chromosomal replication initiation ATPase DnaA
MAPRQLPLDLPHRPALAREDFLVAHSNQAAVALVDQWPDWPAHGAIIIGPPGSGKSHLASVWQEKSGAGRSAASRLVAADIPRLMAGGTLVIEDIDQGIADEVAIFHALNLARQNAAHVLLTGRNPVASWQVALPDLRSRLSALPLVAIQPPDDALLRGVLVKHFADRQISVGEALIGFIMLRMPRSLAAAQRLVERIDRQALEQGVEITRPFVAKVLETETLPDLFDPET